MSHDRSCVVCIRGAQFFEVCVDMMDFEDAIIMNRMGHPLFGGGHGTVLSIVVGWLLFFC